MKAFVWTLLIGMLATPALAETRYVSDQLEIPLRSGTSTQHRIIRMLDSGTPLEVLEVDADAGYSRVRAPSGVEGWVLSRLLMDIPSARDRLARAEKKLAELQTAERERLENLNNLKSEKGSLEGKLSALLEENNRLKQELMEIRRTASSSLAIAEENKELKNRLLQMGREQQRLVQENAALSTRTKRDWFMVGAGVIIVGIILGLILPRIRVRKRSSWDTL
ncbi:MAG TPA: TIGR04211 family SH3 domain-containing protein [Thiohalobacter sp.]|nr:TIGR04211 family SH3 domain-containing protein [Thiohalobacter sp.]